VCEAVQRGLNSVSYDRGRYSSSVKTGSITSFTLARILSRKFEGRQSKANSGVLHISRKRNLTQVLSLALLVLAVVQAAGQTGYQKAPKAIKNSELHRPIVSLFDARSNAADGTRDTRQLPNCRADASTRRDR
jgi:hypothetical protein